LSRRLLISFAFTALIWTTASVASAEEPGAPEKAVHEALEALQRGAFDEAIDRLELLADQGFVHPDASFDRAVAYVRRARSQAARPGDLGRAAAAFSETLLLRPSDEAAQSALERVQSEIARKRAREGAQPVTVRPTLGRALVSVLPEDVWAIAALLGSLVMTLGLVVRRLGKRSSTQLGGATAAAIGFGVLTIGASLTAGSRHFRRVSDPAIVVVPEARLLDATGAPIVPKNGVPEHVAVPEGASVEVRERRGELARIEWGPIQGFVPLGQLRVLSGP
jgi:hypothetical protein